MKRDESVSSSGVYLMPAHFFDRNIELFGAYVPVASEELLLKLRRTETYYIDGSIVAENQPPALCEVGIRGDSKELYIEIAELSFCLFRRKLYELGMQRLGRRIVHPTEVVIPGDYDEMIPLELEFVSEPFQKVSSLVEFASPSLPSQITAHDDSCRRTNQRQIVKDKTLECSAAWW